MNRTQDISRGTYDRRRTNARHLDRSARKTFREERMAGMRQTKNIPIEPHNRRDSSAEPHRGNHIADTNGRAIRSIACVRFKRNPTARRAGKRPYPSADDTFPCGKPRFPPPSEKRIQTNKPKNHPTRLTGIFRYDKITPWGRQRLHGVKEIRWRLAFHL